MRLQTNTISNTHHNLIILDVDGVINTTFAHSSKVENYSEETIGKEIAEYFLNNKEELNNFVIYDDSDGHIARLFPNSYLLVDTLVGLDDDICQKVKDVISEQGVKEWGHQTPFLFDRSNRLYN